MENIDGVDYISCKICGKRFLQLNHRHIKSHNMTTEEYKNKFNITSLTCKKYSMERQNTFLKKYGVKNQFGRKDIKIDRQKQISNTKRAMLDKYGVENISSLDWIKEKKKKNCLEKYGVPTNLNLEEVKQKSKESINRALKNREASGERDRRKKAVLERKRIKGKLHTSMGTLKKHLRVINPHNKSKIKEILNRVGYSLEDVKAHLMNRLPENVTWDQFLNSKNKYSIDHIIPKDAYLIKTEFDDEFMKCWNLRNLRVITISENSKKRNKICFDLIKKYDIEDLLPETIFM